MVGEIKDVPHAVSEGVCVGYFRGAEGVVRFRGLRGAIRRRIVGRKVEASPTLLAQAGDSMAGEGVCQTRTLKVSAQNRTYFQGWGLPQTPTQDYGFGSSHQDLFLMLSVKGIYTAGKYGSQEWEQIGWPFSGLNNGCTNDPRV